MSTPQAKKKLVQGRLPFQVLGSPDSTLNSSTQDTGKKKRDESFEDEQSVKKPRLDDVQIATTDESDIEQMEVDDDDDTECVVLEETQNVNEMISTPNDKKIIARKITPKQLEKRKEIEKRREEKERLRKERNLQKEEERREKQRIKDEKKKILEEKELLKKKAKEERELRKQQEIEEKKEEKLRKELEKKKKEEELSADKIKFAKEAAVFTNFFKKVDPDKVKRSNDNLECSKEATTGFKPFAVKNRMRLAPICRNPLNEERRIAMDNALNAQNDSENYLVQLKNGSIQPKKSLNTWPLEELYQDDENEVEEWTEETEKNVIKKTKTKNHAKLLQFCENRRPPYWGTWRKRSMTVGPRRPLARYKEFDYDVDSDEEWEEEEPGESLHGSDDEKEKDEADGEDDYEVDNDLFVPHGYLSEDEAQPDEGWDVEQQKEKLKLLGEQFDNERNEKTKKLRPIVIGCVWTVLDSDKFTTGNPKLDALFHRCIPFGNECELPLVIEMNDANLCLTDGRDNDSTSPSTSVRRGAFPEDAIPLLVSKLHGSVLSRLALARDFVTDWTNNQPANLLSVAAVSKKIRELAQWQPVQGRNCWCVLPELREKFGCIDLEACDDATTTVPTKITKFTKVMTEEELRNSLKPRTSTTDVAAVTPMVEKTMQKLNQFRANPSTAPKKRVAILCSTPLGVPIPISSPDVQIMEDLTKN